MRGQAWLLGAVAGVLLGAVACASPAAEPAGDAHVGDGGADEVWTVAPAGQVKIATYNARRFFDSTCDSGRCGPMDFESAPQGIAYDREVKRVVAAVRDLNAGLVLLQEIESQAALDALLDGLGDGAWRGVIGETGFPGSLDVAVVSRWPIERVLGHRDTPIPHPWGGTTRFARELLEVHLDVDGQPIVVFVAHFKSKFDDDPWRRVAEATAARAIVTSRIEASPASWVILGGDLNDTPGSLALDILLADDALVRVNDDLPPAEDWTITYQGRPMAIDHLLLSPDAAERYVDGSALAVRGAGGSVGHGGSDHAAVRATFALDNAPERP